MRGLAAVALEEESMASGLMAALFFASASASDSLVGLLEIYLSDSTTLLSLAGFPAASLLLSLTLSCWL